MDSSEKGVPKNNDQIVMKQLDITEYLSFASNNEDAVKIQARSSSKKINHNHNNITSLHAL